MADFNSKYPGEKIEEFLDQVNELELGNYALKSDVTEAINTAIVSVLNTEV